MFFPTSTALAKSLINYFEESSIQADLYANFNKVFLNFYSAADLISFNFLMLLSLLWSLLPESANLLVTSSIQFVDNNPTWALKLPKIGCSSYLTNCYLIFYTYSLGYN